MKTVHQKLDALWNQAMEGNTDRQGWTVHLDELSLRELMVDRRAVLDGSLEIHNCRPWRDMDIHAHRAVLALPPITSMDADLSTMSMDL